MLIRVLLASLIVSLAAGRVDAGVPHLRPLSESATIIIERGLARSPTFRDLVARLNRSDVVVYVDEDHFQSRALAGQLSFLTRAGGYRYVRVRLQWRSHDVQQVATLAHELQHALEIAGRPDIVDHASMARAFADFGHQRSPVPAMIESFETTAAIDAGDRVWRELAGRNGSESAD
jgi:hypothetical protein